MEGRIHLDGCFISQLRVIARQTTGHKPKTVSVFGLSPSLVRVPKGVFGGCFVLFGIYALFPMVLATWFCVVWEEICLLALDVGSTLCSLVARLNFLIHDVVRPTHLFFRRSFPCVAKWSLNVYCFGSMGI